MSRAPPAQPEAERPTRRAAGMALVEPAGAGPVAGDHRQERAQVLSVAMLDQRLGSLLEHPPGAVQPPAEVDVAGRADPLGEPAEGLERRTPHEQVARRRGHPGRAVDPLRLVEEVPIARVAGQQAALVSSAVDAARDRPRPPADRLGEVAVEQVVDRDAVGVDEQQPVARRARSAGVAGVIGGALAGRLDDVGEATEDGRDDSGPRVVGDDQLVARPELEPLEPRCAAPRVGAVTAKRDDDADRRPPHARRLSRRA